METRRLLICFVSIIGILFTTLLVVTNPRHDLVFFEPRMEQYDEMFVPDVEDQDPDETRRSDSETMPTINESVGWLVAPREEDADLLAIEDTVASYYTLLINSFACGELLEDYDFLDLSEIQMQNVVRYLANKMLSLEVLRAHDIEELYHWHKPLVKIDQQLLSGEEAEVVINLRLTNITPDDHLPELVKLGSNRFRLRKIDGSWKIYDTDLLADVEGTKYLNRDTLIDSWTKESIENMLSALLLNGSSDSENHKR